VRFFKVFKLFKNSVNLFALLKGIAKKDEQLTTFQANETRLVTKVRWVTEDDNGETITESNSKYHATSHYSRL
jgi:hypothetical protein